MTRSRFAELALAFAGAVICLGVAILFALNQPGPLLPFPGLYLLEIALLGLIGLVGAIRNPSAAHSTGNLLTWVAGGALLAFVILGAWSVGLFLIPAWLAFWLAGVAGSIRTGSSIPRQIGISLVAALLQAALMLVLILLDRL